MSREKQSGPKKACCMISEALEESGIDREQLRRVRRQVLEGIVLLCQWQLERMDEGRRPATSRDSKGRRITVE